MYSTVFMISFPNIEGLNGIKASSLHHHMPDFMDEATIPTLPSNKL